MPSDIGDRILDNALKKLDKNLKRKITNSAKANVEETGGAIALATKKLIKQNLFMGTQPFHDSRSENMVRWIMNRVGTHKIISNGKKVGYNIYIPRGNNNLSIYLEFGTGYLGSKSTTIGTEKYRKDSGWRYMLNYKEPFHYKNGFFFSYTGREFISNTDKHPFLINTDGEVIETETPLQIEYLISGSERNRKLRNGEIKTEKIGSYLQKRTRHPKTKSVYSQGIKGIFYVYRSKRYIQSMIKRSKDVYALRKKLKEFSAQSRKIQDFIDNRRS